MNVRRSYHCSCGLSVVLEGNAVALAEHGRWIDAIADEHCARGHRSVTSQKAAGVRRTLARMRELDAQSSATVEGCP